MILTNWSVVLTDMETIWSRESFRSYRYHVARQLYSWEEDARVIKIGLLCTQAAASLRPSMSQVVWMLTGEQEHISSPIRPTFTDPDNVGTPDQVQRCTVSKTSSSNWSSNKANSSRMSLDEVTASRTSFNIHSAAADPSSGIGSQMKIKEGSWCYYLFCIESSNFWIFILYLFL